MHRPEQGDAQTPGEQALEGWKDYPAPCSVLCNVYEQTL